MTERVYIVSLVKNERDIIAAWCDYYLCMGADGILVLDGSDDETRDILQSKRRQYPDMLTLFRDTDPGYRQHRKTTWLCEIASSRGATFLFPIDADEFWRPRAGTLAAFAQTADDVARVEQVVFSPSCRVDRSEENPVERIRGHGPRTTADSKVCFRWQVGASVRMGNHFVVLPGRGRCRGRITSELVIHHYPYRSEDQFVAKIRKGMASLTAAPELSRRYCHHWRRYGEILESQGEPALRRCYWDEIYHDETRVQALEFTTPCG